MFRRPFQRALSALFLCASFGVTRAFAQTAQAPASPAAPSAPTSPAPASSSPAAPSVSAPVTPPASPFVSGNTGSVDGGPNTSGAVSVLPNIAPPVVPPANVPASNAGQTSSSAPTPAPAAMPVAAPALPARGTLTVSGTADSLSVFAVSADAAELLTTIAARAGLALVVDDTVSRRITISVKDRPAREIISSIAGAYGLAAADVDGVTLVSEGIPRSPSSYLLSDIEQISTKYVDANNARNLLPVFLQDYVKVNSEQNAVVLSAPAEVLAKFRADIAGFDIPSSQIIVDLLLVELTDTNIDQFNLNLNYAEHGKSFNISPTSGVVSYQALTTLTPQFFAQLTALQQKGRARVRANPRIATISGRHATIFVGRQRYIVTPIDTGQGQRNFIDAGVRLDITPYTGGEKSILIDADAEVSTLSAVDPRTNLPEKSTRTANTRVRVSDGQTVVIGGLKQTETNDVTTRVPILGQLPILGPLLFRTKDRRTTDTNLILFITPRILSDTGHLPASEESALKDRFLNPDLSAPLPPPNFTSPAARPPISDAVPTPRPVSPR